jgi:hypothetical protein
MSRSLFQAKLWAQLRLEFLHKKVIKVLSNNEGEKELIARLHCLTHCLSFLLQTLLNYLLVQCTFHIQSLVIYFEPIENQLQPEAEKGVDREKHFLQYFSIILRV